MTKPFVRRMIWVCLLALAGFFIIVRGIDTILYDQQTAHLQSVYDTWHDLGGDTTQTKVFAEDSKTTITVLDGTAKTTRNRIVQKVVDNDRTRAGHGNRVVVNGTKEQVYIGRIGEVFIGVWQPQASLWRTAPAWGWAFTVVYWLIAGGFLLWLWRRHHYWVKHLAHMTANIQRIRHGEPVTPLILTPHSPFLPMGEALNSANSAVTHLRHKVALRQASFDRLIDHLPQGVMLIDADRQVILSNQALGTLIGHPVAPGHHNYLDDIKTYALARMIEHTFRKQKNHHREITLIATQKAVDANVISLAPDDQHQQVLVILYDVTFLRQVERMQLDFVGNVSHELKTPVTAITGFAETLLNGAMDDEEARVKFLQIIYNESTRLTQLINDILTLSRPENEALTLEAVQPKALIDEAITSLAQPIEEKHLTVTNQLAPTLTIRSDAVKLSQVIRNLLNNAVFYNRLGGQVTISAQPDETELILTFQDTGIGIAENDQERIFERFYRVDKARSRHNGGTGLGLAIVAEMVKQLGGEITLKSQLGLGSTFTVTLPVN
ncbi:two-component system histidine kinase PnpS [Lacticaseibacillus mingshuiensis]|uniref:two-component system histidine kinase PnpS n=1 Tax=Lacticaseibacillus mingshuiensis TaxID=2799574 RepID=UPI001950D45B|nr:ATP-binding protein [Lacticaseibacillus mingshuiensis]